MSYWITACEYLLHSEPLRGESEVRGSGGGVLRGQLEVQHHRGQVTYFVQLDLFCPKSRVRYSTKIKTSITDGLWQS